MRWYSLVLVARPAQHPECGTSKLTIDVQCVVIIGSPFPEATAPLFRTVAIRTFASLSPVRKREDNKVKNTDLTH